MCTIAESRNGKIMRAVNVKHKRFRVTHAERKNIPANTTFDRTVEMSKQTTLTASISATASMESEAGAYFAKAKVAASVTIAGEGQRTKQRTVTEHFSIAPSSRWRRFVFYSGHDRFAFKAHKRVCSMQGQDDYFGTLSSWHVVPEDGAVLCPRTRYRTGSLNYQIAQQGGC